MLVKAQTIQIFIVVTQEFYGFIHERPARDKGDVQNDFQTVIACVKRE